MKARVLMYHDVTAQGCETASGFPSADAALYKLEKAHFAAHLAALSETMSGLPPSALAEVLDNATDSVSWLITFDDGGASAATEITPALAAYGWRGWFFMTTDYVGEKAFLDAAQLRALHADGHIIGSHSCSHPLRFSHLSEKEMLREWRDSRARLCDIVGADIVTASVPGGFYALQVARTAAAAGFQVLFTSEPVTKVQIVDGCRVIGRYAMQHATPPEAAAALAAGQWLPAARQAVWWNTKKVAKTCAGPLYALIRQHWAQHTTRE